MTTKTSEDKLRDKLVKILGLQPTFHGQLVPPMEDFQADWTWTVNDIVRLITEDYRPLTDVQKAFELLESGHGGGSFRRLIIQAKEELKL